MHGCTTASGSNITAHASRRIARQSDASIFDTPEKPADSTATDHKRQAGVGNGQTGVTPVYPYILFNKSPLQLRLIGARGGRAYGRNQRARRALLTTQPEVAPPRAALAQTTAEAVAVLDAQFPWLCGGEQRRSRNQPSHRLQAHSPHGQ
jgi:hypothetical protein